MIPLLGDDHAAPAPQPTATVTITHTATPKPEEPPLTDHLQGWGTVGAVLAALIIALIGWKVEARRRKADQKAGDSERAQDRADADRRLREERQVADGRLQEQLNAQRARDRREFIVRQIQRSGDLYAEHLALGSSGFISRVDPASAGRAGREDRRLVAAQRLHLHLPTVPSPYASLLKASFFGYDSPLMDAATRHAAVQRGAYPEADDPVRVVPVEDIYRELADNISDVLGRTIFGDG